MSIHLPHTVRTNSTAPLAEFALYFVRGFFAIILDVIFITRSRRHSTSLLLFLSIIQSYKVTRWHFPVRRFFVVFWIVIWKYELPPFPHGLLRRSSLNYLTFTNHHLSHSRLVSAYKYLDEILPTFKCSEMKTYLKLNNRKMLV